MPQYNYFMGFARHAATASKDSMKVGAALIDATAQAWTICKCYERFGLTR